MSVRFSDATRRQIGFYAAERGVSLSAAVEELVTAGLNMEARSMFSRDLENTVREAVRSEMALAALGMEEALAAIESAVRPSRAASYENDESDDELWW